MAMHRRALDAREKTALLSVVVGLAGAAVTFASAVRSEPFGNPLSLALITVMFFVAEQHLITFEFRRQSHSMTFAGVPLALGIMMLPVTALVAARLVGSLAALLMHRTSAEKTVYNSAAFWLEAAVSGVLGRLVLQSHALDPVTLALFLCSIALVDQLMTGLVLFLIRIHGGQFTRRSALEVHAQSVVLSVVSTIFAVCLHSLVSLGATGWVLVTVLVAAAVVTYRAYAVTLRRHQSLAMVHDFVTHAAAAETLDDLAHHSLTKIRSVLRASVVELLLVEHGTSDAAAPLVLHLDDEEKLSSERVDLKAADWVRMRALHHGEPTIAVRGKDSALVTWLDSVGLQDAIVVAVQVGADVVGTLTVGDRLTDLATFTTDDLRLLQTLTGHLAMSLHSARLLDTLSYEATHDSLTGLANRSSLSQAIAALDDRPGAVLLLDVDKFKDVNDVLGHDVGDRLLQVIAARLRAYLPEKAVVARLGGDEFAAFLPMLAGTDAAAAAEDVARGLAAQILLPVRFDDALLTPEVSIGIAVAPAVAAQNLLRCADTAMYVAKASPGVVAVYEPGMDSGRAERLALAADMRLALESSPQQFAVYYQPQVDLGSGAIVSAEALVRWLHPQRGLLAPDRFIPLAEAAGLIGGLTTHVLTAALIECARWRRRGHEVTVAVNLSARNLADADVSAQVLAALRAARAEPEWLILEITESTVMQDPDGAVATLTELAALGIGIALDDFGTGYSSLAYLQRLPVRELKIDRSFVTGLEDRGDSATVLFRSITTLGANLGLRVVAEGIETTTQYEAVADLGCDLGQGYLMSRPLPAAEFHTWLDAADPTGLRLIPATA
jgi:diguanylate cyclase (GGDEF)-like protein